MVTNRALLSWLLFANTCQPRVCVRACVSVDRWDPPSKYSTRSTGSLLIVPTEVEGGDRNFPSSCGSVRLLNEGEGKRQSSSLFHFRYISSLSLPWPAPPPPHPPPLPQPSHDFHQPARRGRGRRSGKIRSEPIISRDEFRAMSKSENGEGEGDGKGGRGGGGGGICGVTRIMAISMTLHSVQYTRRDLLEHRNAHARE